MEANIKIKSQWVLTFALGVPLVLLIPNIAGILDRLYLICDGRLFGLATLFDFNGEANIPAFVSATGLLFCSLILTVIGFTEKERRQWAGYWVSLGIVLLFLSFDEAAMFHERLTDPVRSLLHTSGFLYYAWVIPYSIGTLIFLLLILRFLTHLPKRTRSLMILSGGLYTLGALGCEVVGGMIHDTIGTDTFAYSALYTLEELLEMVGIGVFGYTLLTYVKEFVGPIRVSVL